MALERALSTTPTRYTQTHKMAHDIARYIVGIVDEREAAEIAALKSSTLRTLKASITATAYEEDEENEDESVTSTFQTDVSMSIFKVQPAARESPPEWVLEMGNAHLQSLTCMPACDFMVQCVGEKLKLTVQRWLEDSGKDRTDADFELDVRVELTLHQQEHSWCTFRDILFSDDTHMHTWAPAMTEFVAPKAKILVDVAQHITAAAVAGH
jgi:hypothetical protein